MTGSSSIGFASGPTPQIAEALEVAEITSTHWPSSILSRPIRTRLGSSKIRGYAPKQWFVWRKLATGQNMYYTDQSGVIRVDTSGTGAGASRTPIG